MQDTTLLTVFIGMVAIAWLLLAFVVALIGWQVYKILTDVRAGVKSVKHVGAQVRSAAKNFLKRSHKRIAEKN